MSELAVVYTRATQGLNAPLVTVEVHLSSGLPSLSIVGLPETAVRESKERVRSALINSQFEFPQRRITINLAPADLPKEGGSFDLPIAIGILIASKQISAEYVNEYEFAAELALSGKLRSISSSLPRALAAKKAKHGFILPRSNAAEAGLIKGLKLYPASHLLEVCEHLNNRKSLQAYRAKSLQSCYRYPDLNDVKGQHQAKRALEIAACGRHNLLMHGPPGTGKTMLANRIISLLPPLNEKEAIETASLASIRNLKNIAKSFYCVPFRHPHHGSSSVAIIGGGSFPKPGEISLAHHGVLFLDELPEFDRRVLEALREPLEHGSITLSRANAQIEFPAQFQLIAAMNPCPCGYLGSRQKACQCSPSQIQHYKNKISGPLLDRIDMQVEVPELPAEMLSESKPAEPSLEVKKRVQKARDIQLSRQGIVNSQLSGALLEQHCPLGSAEREFLEKALLKLGLSARAYHRIIKIARSIADLSGDAKISHSHLTEALNYRKLEWV